MATRACACAENALRLFIPASLTNPNFRLLIELNLPAVQIGAEVTVFKRVQAVRDNERRRIPHQAVEAS